MTDKAAAIQARRIASMAEQNILRACMACTGGVAANTTQDKGGQVTYHCPKGYDDCGVQTLFARLRGDAALAEQLAADLAVALDANQYVGAPSRLQALEDGAVPVELGKSPEFRATVQDKPLTRAELKAASRAVIAAEQAAGQEPPVLVIDAAPEGA